jgi:hypothetical protein
MKGEGLLALLGSKQQWHDHVGKHLLVCVNSQNFQSPKKNLINGVSIAMIPLLCLNFTSNVTNP